MSQGVNYDLDKYVRDKIAKLQESDKDLRSIFLLMTGEPEKIFGESNDGYAISRTTYGQFKERTEQMAGSLKVVCKNSNPGDLVGLYMNNCEEWLEIFWAILICGFKPLLMNTRMSADILEDILVQYDVKNIISDGKVFSRETITLKEIKDQQKNAPASPIPADSKDWADEIILMSSGTTSNVKLCIYNGETMYWQICDSARIIQENKAMKAHYEGELKQLAFLPFYHVFGLVAVFMWFGFFCRTFVFLKDFSSETLLNTIRRHKVTHIFSIPLLWNTVYETVLRTAKEKGEYEKLMKGIRISGKLAGGPFGNLFTKVAFKSVREQLFGDSIKFMISGGSNISPDVLSFFNAIGYHLADGYGMTEIGITSVELSNNRKLLTSRSVGIPFSSVEYKISDDGELLVKGETMADVVMEGGKVVDKTENGFFRTNDLAKFENGRYYILGRRDDVIIGPGGENLNPDVLEEKFNIIDAEAVCLVRRTVKDSKLPVLVVKVGAYASSEQMQTVLESAKSEIARLSLEGAITGIVLTKDALMDADDFKLNRKKISDRLDRGELREADPLKGDVNAGDIAIKAAEIIANVLGKAKEDVSPVADIFYELGGTSLDYFTIVMEIQKEFNITIPSDSDVTFKTANEFADYIEKHR